MQWFQYELISEYQEQTFLCSFSPNVFSQVVYSSTCTERQGGTKETMLHWLGSQQASRQAGRSSRTRRAPSSWVVLMAIEAPTRGTLLRSKRRTSRVCIIWPRSWDWWGHRKQRLVSRCSLEYIFCCCHSVSTALLTWAGHSITTWTWFHPFGTTYLPTSTWAIIDVFWPPTPLIVST